MKQSPYLNELKCSLALKDAISESLIGSAAQQKKELEMVIFDSCRGFVREIVRILGEEIGDDERHSKIS